MLNVVILSVIFLNAVMLSVIFLNAVMLSVIFLNAVMLSVILLNVVSVVVPFWMDTATLKMGPIFILFWNAISTIR